MSEGSNNSLDGNPVVGLAAALKAGLRTLYRHVLGTRFLSLETAMAGRPNPSKKQGPRKTA